MKKVLIFLFIGLLIIISMVLIMSWSRQPNNGIENKNPDGSAVLQGSQKPEFINTAYFTVTLPAGFEVKTNTEKETGTEMVQIVATQQNSNGKQIAIIVGKLPATGLSDIASYNLRTKDAITYTPVEFGGMPSEAKVFYSTNGQNYEITAFLVRSALYASITVSGLQSDKAAIDQTMLSVLNSWQWR